MVIYSIWVYRKVQYFMVFVQIMGWNDFPKIQKYYRQNQKQSRFTKMAFPLLRSKYSHQLRPQFQSVRRNKTQSFQDKEMKASSSLCQLSDNICFEEGRNERLISLNKKLQTQNYDIGLSPWTSKIVSRTNKQRINGPSKNYSTHFMLQKAQNKKCQTEDIETNSRSIKDASNQNKMLKIKSILQKKPQNEENKKLNPKLQHSEIQLIILMCKRKKYSMETKASNSLIKPKENESQAMTIRNFTSKILNMNTKLNKKQKSTGIRVVNKMNKGQIEESRKFKHQIRLINDHWKAKSIKPNSKKDKKATMREAKCNKQAHEASENMFYQQNKISLAENLRKVERNTNPLAQILYQKYLHTIGLDISNQHKNYYF